LDVNEATLQTIDIGQVAIGPITVGDLVLNNADFSTSAAQGALTNVSVTIKVHISVEWHVHVGLPDGIPDIDLGDTYDLGSFGFGPVAVGNIVIPGLNNIHLHIPSLTAQNLSVATGSLSLQLKNAAADKIHATNLSLPDAGFTIAGLSLTSLQGSGVGIPAAKVDQVAVGHLHGDPVQIPSFTLSNLNLPAAQIPTMSSTAPIDITAQLPTQSPGFDAGIIKVFVHLTPSALSHIDRLEITNANANATWTGGAA
jgi:hypothetical protein